MKYLHLIWASLFRRKTRTILTLVSIVAAFLLFGLLDAVRTSFAQAGQSANGAQRLQTGSKLSFIQLLPQSLEARLEQVPGVKTVTYANWFGGAYQDPQNFRCSRCAIEEQSYFNLHPGRLSIIDPAQTARPLPADAQRRPGQRSALMKRASAGRSATSMPDALDHLDPATTPARSNWNFDDQSASWMPRIKQAQAASSQSQVAAVPLRATSTRAAPSATAARSRWYRGRAIDDVGAGNGRRRPSAIDAVCRPTPRP